MLKGIIFDMDGVIFDSERLWKIAFFEANEKFHLNLSEKYWMTTCARSEESIRGELREMLPSLDADCYRDFMGKRVSEEVGKGNFTLKDGFIEIKDYLLRKGYKLGLATSNTKNRAEKMFKSVGLNLYDIFSSSTFIEDVGAKSKPDPFIFQITAEKMKLKYNECMVLEDSISGIEAAYRGGMIPVHVKDIVPPNDFCRKNCYKMISNLKELKEFV